MHSINNLASRALKDIDLRNYITGIQTPATCTINSSCTLPKTPPFLRCERKGEKVRTKNYVLERKTGVPTPDIFARKLEEGSPPYCKTGQLQLVRPPC
jgi:hypothetical protein